MSRVAYTVTHDVVGVGHVLKRSSGQRKNARKSLHAYTAALTTCPLSALPLRSQFTFSEPIFSD
jgi:1,4-alpha-glucan branching enzyme